MSASDSQLKISCPSCHTQNDAQMSYCLGCGKNLKLPLTATTGNACPRCGRFDQLSTRYCIFCSADTASSAASTAIAPAAATRGDIAKFSWEMDQPRATGEIAVNNAMRTAVVGQTTSVSVAAVTAAVVGGVLALLAAPLIQRGMAESAWKNSSLQIYARQARAQVSIEPTQEPSRFTVGKLGPGGALSVRDVPNGHYLVKISAPDFQTTVFGLQDDVEVDPQHPTTIGYPEVIDLPPKHTAGEQ
ncbi:MAG TPA: zinc ribbon domain-containing protein [Trichormus sp.]